MLTKGEKLTVAFLLFNVALFILGIKFSGALMGYQLSQRVGSGIAATLRFVESNFPKTEPYVNIGFRVLGNHDVIHIDRKNRKITSDTGFTYHYKGYTIKCSVKYDKNDMYKISCEPK